MVVSIAVLYRRLLRGERSEQFLNIGMPDTVEGCPKKSEQTVQPHSLVHVFNDSKDR
jgi:hypothetical protein